jgi:hypothetical protein
VFALRLNSAFQPIKFALEPDIASLGGGRFFGSRHATDCPFDMARSSMKRVYVVRIVLWRMIIGAFHINGTHDDRGTMIQFDLITGNESDSAFSAATVLANQNGLLYMDRDVFAFRPLHGVMSHQIESATTHMVNENVVTIVLMISAVVSAESRRSSGWIWSVMTYPIPEMKRRSRRLGEILRVRGPDPQSV